MRERSKPELARGENLRTSSGQLVAIVTGKAPGLRPASIEVVRDLRMLSDRIRERGRRRIFRQRAERIGAA